MSNTLNFPKPSHPDDLLVYETCMTAIRLLNRRSKGEIKFDRNGYDALVSIHRLCQETGYKSPFTSEQLIDIQSDFA